MSELRLGVLLPKFPFPSVRADWIPHARYPMPDADVLQWSHSVAHASDLLLYLLSAESLFSVWDVYIDGVCPQIYLCGPPVPFHN